MSARPTGTAAAVELELTILQAPAEELGYLAGFVVTDQMIVALGGSSNRAPTVLATSNAIDFETRATPCARGLRDIVAIADSIWACGEYGQLAVTRDHGASWALLETGTEGCLFGLALASDGALWVVGDDGYAARVLGEKPQRLDLGTEARLSAVYAVRDEVVILGSDGQLRRWRDGAVSTVPCGATKPLTGLAITSKGTWVVTGDAGFVARSPDGQWFSRVSAGVDVDLEAIGAMADGTLVIAGDRGQILVSTDDGRTWRGIANELGLSHLWSIERFGGGVLIGGDEGLVVKLAPAGDSTWNDRANLFGGAKPLDDVFVAGPSGFIETRLEAFLDVIAASNEDEEDDVEEDDDEEDDEEARDDGDDDEDEEDDDEEDQDDDPDEVDREDDGDEAGAEAFRVLGEAGTADDFRAIYGVPMPAEAKAFFERIEGRDRWSSFEELRLDNDLRPDVGDRNLFELMVRRNQHAYLGTDLVEAFCGVFGIGSQGNGDTYHLEIYEWDGPRQVLHFDHETHAFSGVFSESLDSLVYLAALVKAGDEHEISKEAYAGGLRKLRGRVSPTWHFSIEDKDDAWVNLEPKRRDTEFFFYRSRWICALLKNDGVTDLDDVPELFMADFNQVIPPDQLPARFEACAKFIPTALYTMWRAYLFDEPELARYLEIGRGHGARLVRDAARLIDDLRGGRNELGTIKDVRAMLAAFRALDLDPRRAEARQAEAEAIARLEAAHEKEVVAQLAQAEPAQLRELAWRWLGDRVAHRALLERLDREQPAQIAALDELRDLRDDERAIALPRLAAELSPELEAVLVGSLVRDDKLDGVLQRPSGAGSGGDDPGGDGAGRGVRPARSVAPRLADRAKGGSGDDPAPGWDAIDAALRPIYGDIAPIHFGTALPYMRGGNDPIHGISVYARTEPVPHWHFITYGFTDLFHKETDDPQESGFGFELTMRIGKPPSADEPPSWALNFLQNLGRYVFGTGNRFAAGHKMGLNGPIALGHDTKITAICFAEDPELGELSSEHGKARFVQIVGITDDEYKLIQEWSTTGLVDLLRHRLPHLVTDLSRASVLDDPATAAEVEQRVAQEGSSEDLTFAGELSLEADDGRVRIELGALYAAAFPRAMRGRIRHGRSYELRGRGATLHLRPSAQTGYRHEEGELVLEVTQELARELEAQLGSGLAGTYRFAAWPSLEIVVTPSFIRSQDGTAIEVRGVADPAELRRMLDAENARLAAEREDEDDDDADDDFDDDDDFEDDDDDDDDLEDGDDAPPDPARVRSALAMTERALRLAPDDSDVQFTHAMLLIDADRGGMEGRAQELFTWLPRFAPSVRINIAVRMGGLAHERFGEAVDVALGEPLPDRMLADQTSSVGRGGAAIASFGDVAHELFSELGDAVLEHAPTRMAKLVPLLPDEVNLISELAYKSVQANQRDSAIALYDRVLALPIPEDGDERTRYLRAINNACIQAHAAQAYDAAVRIAERAQPIAHENPYIFHAAACAYAAVGNYTKAFEQVKLAVEHEYDHLPEIEFDRDLGPLLEWPEFKALFRDWHARQEGN